MATQDSSELPKPKDLSHLLSKTTLNRQASSIKAFYKYFSIPGIGQLAGGLPNSEYFPFDSLEASAALPDRWKPTSNEPVDPPEHAGALSSTHYPSSRVEVPKDARVNDRNKQIDLLTALQYGTAEGYPPLRLFLREFTRQHMHPTTTYSDGPEIILTCGSTDGFSKFLQTFNNEWVEGRHTVKEREGLLVEEFAYMNAVQTARPRGMNIVPVSLDDDGMKSHGRGGLKEVLETWDFARGKRPHLLYTVTMGHNPTSSVVSLPRRREIYELCQQYDIVICEDDPYWYLQYASANPLVHEVRRELTKPLHPYHHPSSGYEFLDSLVPSYTSIDVEGRVVRLDTFSKTVAPGARLGWITAQPAIIERILRITETSTQQPSGFVQSMVAELLLGPQSNKDPGHGGGRDGRGYQTDGWVRWLEGLRGNYERRMRKMCNIFEKGRMDVRLHHEDSIDETRVEWGIVEKTAPLFSFKWPAGGMFLWLEVHFHRHPLSLVFTGLQLSKALWIQWTRKPYRVLVSPGTIFAPTQDIKDREGWKFFRLCFAACPDEEVTPISERFVSGIREFWQIEDPEGIRDLLREADEENSVGHEMLCGNLAGPC
ncbi:MAG: hypothetical protein M1831_001357 [Alyxoria varia]|nr:MAG: hypothetical protein M1831_001357 [Alyxoria varia]